MLSASLLSLIQFFFFLKKGSFCIYDQRLALNVLKSYRGFYLKKVKFWSIFGGKMVQNATVGLQNVPKYVLYVSPIQ